MELECKEQKKGRGFIILPLSVIRDGWLEENNDKSGKKDISERKEKTKTKKTGAAEIASIELQSYRHY